MNFEKVLFGFFILLALTLNFGFVLGDMDNPAHHHSYELFAALVVSIVATIMKLGDRSHMGAVLLATSLVADLHLIAAAIFWAWHTQVVAPMDVAETTATVVSLAGGALIANFASVVLLIIETGTMRR